MSNDSDGAKPTMAVAKQAAKGLALREKHGRGGTQVGLHRGRQLSDREPIDVATLKKMRAYFARHDVDKRGRNWGDREGAIGGLYRVALQSPDCIAR